MNAQQTAPPTPVPAFIRDMNSPDLATRGQATQLARQVGANAITLLADLAISSDPAIAKNARMTIEAIAHQAAAPNAPKGEKERAADALLALAQTSTRPRMVRAHALKLLGFVGEKKHAQALRPLLADRELGEDARMATERMK